MKGLTPRQRQLLDYIEQYLKEHRYAPSYREMMSHFGFSSLGSIYKHVTSLKRKGFLTAEKSSGRSLNLTTTLADQESSIVQVPFMGYLSAGYPIETFPQVQMLSLPSHLIQNANSSYALQVKGDSLHEELIADGDLIIVDTLLAREAGDTIVVLVDQHDTLIRQYHPEGEYIRLTSLHPNNQPLILRAEEVAIQGIVTGVIRTLR